MVSVWAMIAFFTGVPRPEGLEELVEQRQGDDPTCTGCFLGVVECDKKMICLSECEMDIVAEMNGYGSSTAQGFKLVLAEQNWLCRMEHIGYIKPAKQKFEVYINCLLTAMTQVIEW